MYSFYIYTQKLYVWFLCKKLDTQKLYVYIELDI
jgi:hypothetical protein